MTKKKTASVKSKQEQAAAPEKGTQTLEQAQMQTAALEKLHAAKKQFVTIDELDAALDRDWNPGGRAANDYIDLLASIKMIGLKKLIVVAMVAGVMRVIQGYLRSDAFIHWANEDNSTFGESYPKGIPVMNIGEVTEEEAYFLACDHDTVARNRWAIYLQGATMIAADYTESAVAVAMHAELASVFGLKADVREEIAKAESSKAAEDRIAKYWRQRTQEMRAIANLPTDMVEAFRRKTLGEEGDTLTGAQMKSLDGLNKKEGGTIVAPSDNCLNQFQQFIKDNAAGNTGPKPMPQSKMKESYRRLTSYSLRALMCKVALSAKIDLTELDSIIAAAEEAGSLTVPENIRKAVETAHSDMVPTAGAKS